MQIKNEILKDFITCQYKAYRKSKGQSGTISDYQILYNQLRENKKENFEKTISVDKNIISSYSLFDNIIHKEGISLNLKFANENIDLTLDGVEFTGKKNIVPLFITPFEKVTKTDKLFVTLQATFIQNEYNLLIENCKIVSGINLKQSKFKVSSFTKPIKKLMGELNRILSNKNPPVFFKNNHCQVCEFQNSCLAKLIERDDLSPLTALKPKEILQKNNRGVFSVKQLSYTFRPKKNPYQRRKFLPELKALAIREDKTFILEIPKLKQVETNVYLDFEGILDRGSNYLIGVILKTNEIETEYSFWANNEDQQTEIFIELINLLKPLNSFTIYHYGSYEIHALKSISKKLSVEQQDFLKIMIDNSFNVLNIFSHNIYPPTYSNSLKEISRFLKFEWTEKNASGLQSVIWRYNWELSQNEDLKNKLITYNIEDCRALIKVKDWILNIPENGNEKFENAEKFKRDSIYKWGRVDFLVKELEQINRFAYFNYQREKILIKTYPKIALQYRKIKKNRTIRKFKANKTIELQRPKICVDCGGNRFYRHDIQNRSVTDLKISKTGIKRFIILYKNARYKCLDCKKIFMPRDEINIRSKFGKNLNFWIINQMIQYRISYKKISAQLKESFDIDYTAASVRQTKSNFAEYYKSAFNEIIEKVSISPLIHIDETIFHIRKETCYVWVFTNIDTVFYLFKPTRESEFLKELLVDFKGVLISDFYAGYDAVNCAKQRCLIHIIRDLNDDLAKNQLDNDFKIIVLNFSKLLSEIMFTINRFGLKRRNLNKHKKAVDVFLKSVSVMEFESEICAKWQKRFNSFKDELFTFLDYNGVPWNNNNAETAIKAVALYRRE